MVVSGLIVMTIIAQVGPRLHLPNEQRKRLLPKSTSQHRFDSDLSSHADVMAWLFVLFRSLTVYGRRMFDTGKTRLCLIPNTSASFARFCLMFRFYSLIYVLRLLNICCNWRRLRHRS